MRTLKVMCGLGLAASLGLVVSRAPAQTPGDEGYIIRDVSVVDVEGGVIRANQDVYVVGKRIHRIAPALDKTPRQFEIVDGSGLYLMPGLFDAHVHLMAGGDAFGPMLVANGVTCVRDTGAATDAIVAMRDGASAGGSLLPRIICTGAIVDGDPAVWPFSYPCDEPEEARIAVRKLADAGVDQIKVYSLLEIDVYRAAVDEAHKLGLKATGHVPLAVTLEQAMAAGQDCCEHLTGFDRAVGEMAGWQPPNPDARWAWFGAWVSYPDVPPAQLKAFAGRVAASGMHQCPTIVVMQGIGSAATPDEANKDPRMAYVPAPVRSFWGGARYVAMADNARNAATYMKAMVGELHRAGVPLMIGTDLANPYVFAGFSVHDEMANFQSAGLAAADVLRAATVVPARFCGVADTLGTVDEGKAASLVLVRGNPLLDVRHAAEIEAVFLDGRYFDRDALDAIIEGVAAANRPVATPETARLELPGNEIARGRYRSKFQEFDAGTEDFLITRDDKGYHFRADSRPTGGPMPPFELTYHVSGDFEFRAATWKVLRGAPLEATYSMTDGTITATARQGDETLPAQTIEFEPNMLVMGPATVTDFASIGAAGLSIGESRTFRAVAFGFSSWEMGVTDYTLTRHEAEYYTYALATDWAEFTGEIQTDASGVVVKSTLKMPMGTITTVLEPKDDEDDW